MARELMAEGDGVRHKVKLFKGTEHSLAFGGVEHADYDSAICLEDLPGLALLEFEREVLETRARRDVRHAFFADTRAIRTFCSMGCASNAFLASRL